MSLHNLIVNLFCYRLLDIAKMTNNTSYDNSEQILITLPKSMERIDIQ
jgi:hypothetical protein